MHEWALAESVVKTLKNRKKTVFEAEVIFGTLQDIDEEIFTFALKEILNQEDFKVKIKITKEDAVFECLSCGKIFDLKEGTKDEIEKENIHFLPEMAKVFLKCPSCKAKDFEIKKGRGLSLKLKEK
ncbi:MAG: hydrogenase nickel incorporation protein HypA [Elusimicrobia bacterium]|nr:hydrogenase nickel incorporation protein HypA [Elusimicrobiota bacterium]